jgi:CxxC motif-containing protein (DUF1111 family)
MTKARIRRAVSVRAQEATVRNRNPRTLRYSRLLSAIALLLSIAIWNAVAAAVQDPPSQDQARRQRFTPVGSLQTEAGPDISAAPARPTEAPTGFDNRTNGFDPQGAPYHHIDEDSVVPLRSFNDNRFIFEEVERVEDGLGPTYNAQSCRECHQNVVTGGASQVAEHRTGRLLDGAFFESQGGSLVHSRATNPLITELVAFEDDIRTFRISTTTLGAGFVEAIANETLLAIRDAQPEAIRGTAINVPVLEAPGTVRLGRFGWKDQHASLESFSADAYLNEMGITTPLFPDENTSAGNSVARFDSVRDPEDDGVDVVAFANFMRATKAPPRGPIDAEVQAGETLFTAVGCASCHVASIITSPPGSVINGGQLIVRPALGNKVIHPYSDYLLHDIGSGDGIPVQPIPEFALTANQMRTAPLWGLRTRNRLMHDGLSFTREEAIARHGGQAAGVRQSYEALSVEQKRLVLKFLNSL